MASEGEIRDLVRRVVDEIAKESEPPRLIVSIPRSSAR